MLLIKNLSVKIKNNLIINNLNLKINNGETHVLMGPNGSGKSTLSLTIAGHEECEIINGEIIFNKINITNFTPYKRSIIGIFLSFQNPIEIPGISNIDFLKNSLDSIRKEKKLKEIDFLEFKKKIIKYTKELKINESFLYRHVNLSYSGGEKKKNEILQMKIIKPKFSILDEIDSGLDIDSLKIISNSIKKFKTKNRSILIITHRKNILNYINPDFVHIIINGVIKKSGNIELSKKIEKLGYEWIKKN